MVLVLVTIAILPTTHTLCERSLQSHGKCVCRALHFTSLSFIHLFVRSFVHPFIIVLTCDSFFFFVFPRWCEGDWQKLSIQWNKCKRTKQTVMYTTRKDTNTNWKCSICVWVSAIKIDYPPTAPINRFSSCIRSFGIQYNSHWKIFTLFYKV